MDLLVPIRQIMMADSDLYSLVGQRIYAHRDNPPEKYQISSGPCVCLKVRGGSPPYVDGLDAPSIQIRCFGQNEAEAMAVNQAVFEVLHEYQGATVRWMTCEVYGQLVYDPQSKWVTVVSFFKAILAKS